MLKKLLSIVAYAALFLVSTLLFSYFLFPLDQLREYLESQASTSSKYRLEIGDMERQGIGTLVLTDISVGVNRKLIKRPRKQPARPLASPLALDGAAAAPAGGTAPGSDVRGAVPDVDPKEDEADGGEETGAGLDAEEREGDDGEGADEFTYIDIDSITLEFDLMQLLNPAELALELDVELLGGFIENGRIEMLPLEGKSRVAVNLPVIEDLEFGETEFFGSLFSSLLPSMRSDKVTGFLREGSIELVPAADEGTTYYTGEIAIELADLVALEPVLVQNIKKTGQSVEVPLTDLRLGKCEFRLRLDRKDAITELDKVKTKHKKATVVLFEKSECKGESLDYYIKENSFILFPPKVGFAKARMDFWTKLAFNPDYFDEERKDDEGNPLTRNKELGQGLEFDRLWQRAQDVDGFYWMHCKGTLGSPKCKRGLPPEEKRRKNALKELERQRKKEEAAKKRAEERSGVKKKTVGKSSPLDPKRPDRVGSSKTTSTARERAEKMRAERARKRQEEHLNRVRQPSGPGEQPGVGGPPSDDEEPLEGEEEYEGEEGYDEEPLEGEEGYDEEPVEGDEGYLEEGDELPPEEGEVPPEGEEGVEGDYPEEGVESPDGELPPEEEGEALEGEEMPAEEGAGTLFP